MGMEITFLPGAAYEEAQIRLSSDLPDWMVIPMGGAHSCALGGVAAMMDEIRSQIPEAPTHYAIPAGTGTTAAGLAMKLESSETLMVFPAIKGSSLDVWFEGILDHYGIYPEGRVVVDTLSAGKGFARKDRELWKFLTEVAQSTGIVFDPVYNGKMAFRIWKLVQEDYFPAGSILVIIHTGGWPGRAGYQHRYQLEAIPGSPELQADFWDIPQVLQPWIIPPPQPGGV
jgi:1-aminocyclopropane-1-carboxylate deaminase/D-cysteine desulfhydrase-like pyridoxal-dependent ACC family enzyme